MTILKFTILIPCLVDENELTVDSYLALKHLLTVNRVLAHVDRPVADIAASKVTPNLINILSLNLNFTL